MVNLSVSQVPTLILDSQKYLNQEAAVHLKRAKFIFAFPGMGKTPLALRKKGYADADFGFFRTAFKVEKAKERVLFKPYWRLIDMMAEQGFKVLINQPDIMEFVRKKEAVCILPANPRYAAKKMGVDIDTILEWVSGWEDMAIRLGVPCFRVSIGLDML